MRFPLSDQMNIIREACIWTAEKLAGGYDYKETHYQSVLGHALMKRGFVVSSEENIEYSIMDDHKRIVFGFGRLDLKVTCPIGRTWILELKCVSNLKYIEAYRAQLKRYIKHTREPVLGVLIIFNNTESVHIEKHLDIKCQESKGSISFGLSSDPSRQQSPEE